MNFDYYYHYSMLICSCFRIDTYGTHIHERTQTHAHAHKRMHSYTITHTHNKLQAYTCIGIGTRDPEMSASPTIFNPEIPRL